jgi:hypothetical protein
MLKTKPEIFIPNYKKLDKDKKIYYQTVLGIGEYANGNGNGEHKEDGNGNGDESISDRYRTVKWK